MKHRAGLDRSQTLLFPERLKDYIAAENPVALFGRLRGFTGFVRAGFSKARCADTGRRPYGPAVLLKLYLYGYLHRVRSSRLLEAECQRNVEVIWLLGKQTPDFKTIADFRKDNLQPLKPWRGSSRCSAGSWNSSAGSCWPLTAASLGAVNARDQNFNAGKLKDLIDRADARLAEYFQQLDAVDASEPEGAALTKSELAQKIAVLQEKRDWHQELLGELDEEQKQIR